MIVRRVLKHKIRDIWQLEPVCLSSLKNARLRIHSDTRSKTPFSHLRPEGLNAEDQLHAPIYIVQPLDIILTQVCVGLDFNDLKRLGALVGEAVFGALRDIRGLINREG